MTARWKQCRYLRKNGQQCTAEALDDSEDALVVLCAHHTARTMQLVKERAALTTRRTA